jgi:hypothetical protein
LPQAEGRCEGAGRSKVAQISLAHHVACDFTSCLQALCALCVLPDDLCDKLFVSKVWKY